MMLLLWVAGIILLALLFAFVIGAIPDNRIDPQVKRFAQITVLVVAILIIIVTLLRGLDGHHGPALLP